MCENIGFSLDGSKCHGSFTGTFRRFPAASGNFPDVSGRFCKLSSILLPASRPMGAAVVAPRAEVVTRADGPR